MVGICWEASGHRNRFDTKEQNPKEDMGRREKKSWQSVYMCATSACTSTQMLLYNDDPLIKSTKASYMPWAWKLSHRAQMMKMSWCQPSAPPPHQAFPSKSEPTYIYMRSYSRHAWVTYIQGNKAKHYLHISNACRLQPQLVLSFSKLNNFIFGYFDPENRFLDNENK